jgi:hypothetical protein
MAPVALAAKRHGQCTREAPATGLTLLRRRVPSTGRVRRFVVAMLLLSPVSKPRDSGNRAAIVWSELVL